MNRAEVRSCLHCGTKFAPRTDKPGLFCTPVCARLAQGYDGTRRRRFRVSSRTRLTVLERDGWVCQICNEAIDPGAEPRSDGYPTLDHIVPRSRGGSDDVENLRAAHLWCNSFRGAPELMEVA